MRFITILFCFFIGFSVTNAAQIKTAQTVKQSDVKKQPNKNAKTVATLPKDAKVTVESRQRAWYQVSTGDGVKGWIKMLKLRFANVSTQASSGSLWNSLTTQHSSTTASTGIRGFSEEDLRNASPNMNAVKSLARFKANSQQIKQFAKQGKLNTNNNN